MTEYTGVPVTERLRGGLDVTIRPLRALDRDRIAAAIGGLDRSSVYFRLFSYRNELTEQGLDRIMDVDAEHDAMLVATVGTGSHETVIASGRFIGGDDEGARPSAEVAFVVEEDYHGRGLAGRLLAHLAAIARERGLAALTAEVLAENKAMLAVFARSGLPMRRRQDGGVVHVTLLLDEGLS
jgi:GNAT superfamily N-acetyltransferase